MVVCHGSPKKMNTVDEFYLEWLVLKSISDSESFVRSVHSTLGFEIYCIVEHGGS